MTSPTPLKLREAKQTPANQAPTKHIPVKLTPVKQSNVRHVAEKQIERRRQVRGLLILAVFILLFALFHAGFYRNFPPGWWRLW